MRLEEFAEAFAECAGSVAVDDADARLIGERGFIEVFVDALCRFFHTHADHVDLARGCTFAGLRCHGDTTAPWRLLGRGLPLPRCRSAGLLDAGDLVDGNLHAQWTSFDFGGGAI